MLDGVPEGGGKKCFMWAEADALGHQVQASLDQ
jgi:hypothetical protein